jgi:hypothetical protein
LYGCGILSLDIKGGCRLKVFERSMLRRIYGLKRDELVGFRKLHNEWRNGLIFVKHNFNEQGQEAEVSWVCNTWREEECIRDFGGKARREMPLGGKIT